MVTYASFARQVCLLTELKPLVFSREVLSEVLMLAAVQEHVQSAACVLYQVRPVAKIMKYQGFERLWPYD